MLMIEVGSGYRKIERSEEEENKVATLTEEDREDFPEGKEGLNSLTEV